MSSEDKPVTITVVIENPDREFLDKIRLFEPVEGIGSVRSIALGDYMSLNDNLENLINQLESTTEDEE